MAIARKNRASKVKYLSQHQLVLEGFETPFHQKLDATNRWVVLAQRLPWDVLVGVYNNRMHNSKTGADGINPRVALGAIIIKHMCDLSDRETVLQIQENMYMQYFIGYSSYSNSAPFDPSLFVEFRSRLSLDQINLINEKIIQIVGLQNKPAGEDKERKEPPSENMEHPSDLLGKAVMEPQTQRIVSDMENPKDADGINPEDINLEEVPRTLDTQEQTSIVEEVPKNLVVKGSAPSKQPAPQGKMITDATACPQDIAYPTDLNLLNDAREKSEELIDVLYCISQTTKKPRTDRNKARKQYLRTAQKKSKTNKEIRKALRHQLVYLRRNLKFIDKLLDEHTRIPLNKYQLKYLFVIKTLYDQQLEMYQNKVHSVEDRIVSIHQPHNRPIVRGKTTAKVEFGAKIQVSIMQGYTFLDLISWDAFNEGTRLMDSVEHHKRIFGYYPKEVFVDKIYCTRANRAKLKELQIQLIAKPLGRPKAVPIHISPGARNPIEGKFGQAKSAYGMNRIKARLKHTSESWIASIIMVLNLVKLAGEVPYFLYRNLTEIVYTLQLMLCNRSSSSLYLK